MKKSIQLFFTSLFLIIINNGPITAQSPNAIKYQAVVRDNNAAIVVNKTISLKISLLQGASNGTEVYVETFTPTTNAFGQVSLEIGNGTMLSGNFSTIDWSSGIYFAKVELDLNGGANYTSMGNSQLMTVPFSKYADMAGTIKDANLFAKKVDLATVATSGKYVDLIGSPVLSAIAQTGKYSDLKGIIALDSTIILTPLQKTDSLRKYIAAGYRTFLLQSGRSYEFDNIVLPANTTIIGNGAKVSPSSTSNKCFIITDVTNIIIRDINFIGQKSAAVGSALKTAHIAIHLTRSQDIYINGCAFINWLGAGIVSQGGTTGISYYNYRMIISNNRFDQCYFGISIADRSEYCMFSNNILSSCRVGTWNSSGNWNIIGNTYVSCRAPYLSYAKTSPFGALSSDNWSHGSFVGNIMNHSNSGGVNVWSSNAAFPIGGVSTDPSGVVLNGVLPPTFTANTMYYTNLDCTGITAAQTGTAWQITGCVFSQNTITASVAGSIALVGCSKQTNVTVNANVIEQITIPTTAIVLKTANYSLTDADRTIIANTGVTNLTLPTAVSRKGTEFIIKSTIATAITLATGGGTIDGAATFIIDGTTVHGLTVQSDGTNWYITSKIM